MICVALAGCQKQYVLPDAPPLQPSFAMYLADGSLGQEDAAALQSLIKQAEQLIPQKLKQTIGRPVAIEIDGATTGTTIATPICEAPAGGVPKNVSAQTLGRSILARHGEPHRIVVHAGLAAVARAGRQQSVRFTCGHKSLYDLALATMVHEVMHIHDAYTKLSHSTVYQNMQQFAPQGPLRKIQAHNKLQDRSPDIYEFYDIAENLAVNFEYFLLDPEYKCRRPAVYRWLADKLEHQPFSGFACGVNTLIYAGNQPVFIDPARVYQIHYLFAARGKGIASRWGHSMFRIVMCSPNRTAVDERCLEDLHDHIVLSFVANLREDLTINAWKGLTGQYLAQMMIRPMTEVLNDYTEFDYRDLQSLPLNLSKEEMLQFVYHTLELYWSYGGRYYFLTNNCADESLRLVQSVLPQKAVQDLSILTPLGLRDDLIKVKAADDSIIADKATALARGYLFQSALQRYDELYVKFRDKLPSAAPRSLSRYVKSTKAAQRREWAQTQVNDPAALSGLFAIEGMILQRLLKEIERIVVIKILFRRAPKYLALGQRLKDYLVSLRQPWELLKGGYGVPLPHEFKLEPRTVRPGFPEEILLTAMSLVKDDYPGVYAEYLRTEQNRKLLLSMILKSSATTTPPALQSAITGPKELSGVNDLAKLAAPFRR